MSIIEVVYKGERLYITKSDIARFHKKYEIDNETGCWNWTAGLFKSGYSQFYFPPIQRGHQFSYLVYNGNEIKNNEVICHKCDNPKCVNPDHLFLGTAYDNMHDMIQKGRKKVGLDSGKSILTEFDVINIRKKFNSGNFTVMELSRIYKVSWTNIKKIVSNNTWKHIEV